MSTIFLIARAKKDSKRHSGPDDLVSEKKVDFSNVFDWAGEQGQQNGQQKGFRKKRVDVHDFFDCTRKQGQQKTLWARRLRFKKKTRKCPRSF